MTRLYDAHQAFKHMGWSRATVKAMFAPKASRGRSFNGARELPQGHRAKRKRLQKIQKESRRRNRI